MKTIYELQQIANRLRQVMEVNSISPEDTFGLQSDVLEYLADMEQNAEGLGIHKVYASYAAMVADASSPVGSNGKALRFGQLVVICNPSNTIQEENGNIYAWQKGNAGDAAWLLIGNLGSVLGNPQNGYYVCDTAAATAEKEISATSYVLSVGGSMKVKMTNANTADNATLNINSTGVKALYYAGERASSINTWEAGETVEVYYDGTSYYANNVAGGSGSGDGAFDVSAKYPTSGVDGSNTYTLGGALAVLNANLSANKKKGGMSIKFIQSSDNKYVQARCMAQSFTTDVTQWQGVDDEPTVGSDNLVKSNGVAFFDDAVLKPYVRLIYIENKEAALQDGIFFKNLQYNYNAIYFGKPDNSYFYVGSLTISPDNTFKYCLVNHDTYGTIYIEVENREASTGDIASGNKNNLKGALCYKPYISLLSRRVNNDRVLLNNSIIRFSNLEKFSSPAQTRWTSSNLNQYVYCLYIENRAAVIENTLALTSIQFDYNAVYFKPANGSQFVKTLRVLENGHRVSEWDDNTYGHCYIEVYNDDGLSHLADTPAGERNICERVFSKDFYDILKLTRNQITPEIILYGGDENALYCTDIVLKNHIISIFVENRGKALENGLYLRYIQYKYNAVWFGDKNGATAFLVGFNRTTYIGERNDATYGYIRIEVAHEAGETEYTSNPNFYNLTERCYNPYYNNGLIKEIQDIKNTIDNKPLSGKKILAIGDSVTVGHQWGNKVAEVTGAEVSFHARSGIGIISMVDGSSPDLAPLSTEDVTDKDYIIALGFYNDRFNGDGGNATDMYPTDTTFTGKLNYLIAKIQEKLIAADNRKCKIVIVSAHRYGKYPYIDKNAYEDGEQLCAATKLCADWNSVYFIDLMHRGNINKFNWDWFQNSSTPYNQNYIPADGDNDGTNKPFNSLEDAPNASENNGKYITVLNQNGCYQSNGSDWIRNTSIPYIWNGDQLHPNLAGYNRIGEFIAGQIVTI